MVLGAPVPRTEKVVSSAQLLLCGASCTHYMITRTNRRSHAQTRTNAHDPIPNTHTGICRSTGPEYIHTHTEIVYTHTPKHIVFAPQINFSQHNHASAQAGPSSWTVNVHNL